MWLRMAGPLPAENTPLLPGDAPSQSLSDDLRVARPMPPGTQAAQTLILSASAQAKACGSLPVAQRASKVMLAWS
jgi:hypothetical protein